MKTLITGLLLVLSITVSAQSASSNTTNINSVTGTSVQVREHEHIENIKGVVEYYSLKIDKMLMSSATMTIKAWNVPGQTKKNFEVIRITVHPYKHIKKDTNLDLGKFFNFIPLSEGQNI